jgi:hypothetical protein
MSTYSSFFAVSNVTFLEPPAKVGDVGDVGVVEEVEDDEAAVLTASAAPETELTALTTLNGVGAATAVPTAAAALTLDVTAVAVGDGAALGSAAAELELVLGAMFGISPHADRPRHRTGKRLLSTGRIIHSRTVGAREFTRKIASRAANRDNRLVVLPSILPGECPCAL